MNVKTFVFFSEKVTAISLIIVLLFGFLLGYFVWNIFFCVIPQKYTVEWSAHWISNEKPVSQAYFRKTLHLASLIKNAWIKVIAKDNVTLRVNGKFVERMNITSSSVTAFTDITPYLKIGKNVIAIDSKRETYPGNAQIAAEISIEDIHGKKKNVVTDKSWKIYPYEQTQRQGEMKWYEIEFDDTSWGNAHIGQRPQKGDNSKVLYNPEIITEPLKGKWIWTPVVNSKSGFFRYAFHLDASARECWIRIFTAESFNLIINDVQIASNQSNLGVRGIPIQLSFSIYNISPFIKKGTNVIGLTIFENSAYKGFLIDGIVKNIRGEDFWFHTSEDWKFSHISYPHWGSRHFDDNRWEKAKVIESNTALLPKVKKMFGTLQLPEMYIFYTYVKGILIFLISIMFILAQWLLFCMVINKIDKNSHYNLHLFTLYVFILPIIFLFSLFILQYDIRFDKAVLFKGEYIFTSLVSIFLIELGIIIFLVRKKFTLMHNKQER